MDDDRKNDRKILNELRNKARELYVINGKSQKDIAALTGVTEKTVGRWATADNWHDARKSRQSTQNVAAENLRNMISLLSARRLQIELEINDARDAGDRDRELELRREANSISDDMSKQNKALVTLNKGSNIMDFGAYIEIMDDIFEALKQYDYDLYRKTTEFQKVHAREMASND